MHFTVLRFYKILSGQPSSKAIQNIICVQYSLPVHDCTLHKCSTLLQTTWLSTIKHHTKFYGNLLQMTWVITQDKKISLHPQKNKWGSFLYQKSRIRVYRTIRHNQRNQTQLHKVNNFDIYFDSKCLHILISCAFKCEH